MTETAAIRRELGQVFCVVSISVAWRAATWPHLVARMDRGELVLGVAQLDERPS